MTLANAQNNDCNCSKDLELLNKKIKKTPSYKINKTVYKNQFLKTEKEVENLNSGYECFVQLNKLMLSLHDNHSRVYGSKEGANEEIINDTVRFNEFKKSKLFNMYPRPNMNLDSLKIVLKNQPIKSIEGIYSRTDYMTLGVYKQVNKQLFINKSSFITKQKFTIVHVLVYLYLLTFFGFLVYELFHYYFMLVNSEA